jgi:type II secretory pathway component PulF
MSDFFFTKWYLILATGFGLNYLSRFLLRQPKIRLEFDRWVLKVPVFGVLLKQLELNNLCIILDILIGSGIPLMEGLGILATTQSNEVFKSELDLARKELEKGSSFTRSIQESSLFPASFKSMVSIGEESGKLQTVLQRLGRYYQVQIDYRLDNLSKLIEPILLFLIFGMVLVLALAIFLPIWKISSVRPN